MVWTVASIWYEGKRGWGKNQLFFWDPWLSPTQPPTQVFLWAVLQAPRAPSSGTMFWQWQPGASLDSSYSTGPTLCWAEKTGVLLWLLILKCASLTLTAIFMYNVCWWFYLGLWKQRGRVTPVYLCKFSLFSKCIGWPISLLLAEAVGCLHVLCQLGLHMWDPISKQKTYN